MDSLPQTLTPLPFTQSGSVEPTHFKEIFKQIPSGNNILIIEIEPSTLEDIQKIKQPTEIIKDYRGLDRFLLFNLS